MADLRQILSQGRKRIGILLGAGAPLSIRVNEAGKITQTGSPLIPDVAGITARVLRSLEDGDKEAIDQLAPELGESPNIETILTRIRRLSQAIGGMEFNGLTGNQYGELADRICNEIGAIVAQRLPQEPNPFSQLVSWIGGTHREHPIEIFTPNYDLLLEEAFERARLPYFDGFTGAHRPFFDPTTIAEDLLPSRWSRIWKIHGSLGWDVTDESVIRTGSRTATSLIYPEHLKYDHIARQPYTALFERLRDFLTTPDSLLICSGFSFFDAHITSVIDESLAANAHTAVLAFQYKSLEEEIYATEVAMRRPNLSVYAKDGAVIFGVPGKWKTGSPPTEEWASIKRTFWDTTAEERDGRFMLGDFSKLATFFSSAHSVQLQHEPAPEGAETDAKQDEDDDTGLPDEN